MKHYFDKLEKINPKEKIKIQRISKRISNNELKKADSFHWSNILHLHYCNSKSPEKKLNEKK